MTSPVNLVKANTIDIANADNNLAKLREAAGNENSIGYLGVDTKTNQYTKLQAHRHLTHLNKQEKTEEISNRWARENVFTTLRGSLIKQTHGKLTSGQIKFLEAAAKELGITVNKEGDVYAEVATPLERRTVRGLLKGLDLELGNKKINAKTADRQSLQDLLRTLGKCNPFADTASTSHLREVCSKILLGKFEGKLNAGDLLSMPTTMLHSFTKAYLDGRITSAQEIKDEIDCVSGKPQINAEEMNEITNAYTKATEEEQALVSLHGEQVIKGPVESEPKPEPKLETEPEQMEMQGVKNMLADIVLDEDTWLSDQFQNEPGKMLAHTLEKHAKALVYLLKHRDELIGVKNPINKEDPDNDPGYQTQPKLSTPALEVAEKVVSSILDSLNILETKAISWMTDEVIEAQIKNKLQDSKFLSTLADAEKEIAKSVEIKFSEIQDTVSTTFINLFCGVGPNVDVGGGIQGLKAMLTQYGINIIIPDKKPNASKFHEGRMRTPLELRDAQKKVDEDNQKREETIIKASRTLLDKMMNSTGFDPSKGYGLFMMNVVQNYFEGINVMDKRAMLAAGIRFAKPKLEAAPDATKKAKEDIQQKNDINMMGAFFKGAGPIMQKMLQGLASVNGSGSMADFKAALEDMKSNLAPIPDTIVKANLLDMIKRSNGKIKEIEVTQSLGAASVGQAFLCTMTLADDSKKDVVIKLLRPDAEQRANREKRVFLEAAKNTPGMQKTFEGQLASIMDELDLRIEAENTKQGVVYDKGIHDVKSMKGIDLIAPTKFSFMVEKAPGTTVDKLFKKIDEEIASIVSDSIESVVDANGNPVTDPAHYHDEGNKITYKSLNIPHNEAMQQTMGKLDKLVDLYERTSIQQKRLITLAGKWSAEGIYNSGYYHGDLHAGNIMVDDEFHRDQEGNLILEKVEDGKVVKQNYTDHNGQPVRPNQGLTIIDFGNATQLTKDQQADIIRMMAAAGVKDTNRFLDGYRNLMSPEGRVKFDAQRKSIHDMVHNIFNLGQISDSGKRIAIVLTNLQGMGHELPAPIFKFSQCQIRLQGTIDEMNSKLEAIQKAMKDVTSTPLKYQRPENMSYFNPVNDFIGQMVNSGVDFLNKNEVHTLKNLNEAIRSVKRHLADTKANRPLLQKQVPNVAPQNVNVPNAGNQEQVDVPKVDAPKDEASKNPGVPEVKPRKTVASADQFPKFKEIITLIDKSVNDDAFSSNMKLLFGNDKAIEKTDRMIQEMQKRNAPNADKIAEEFNNLKNLMQQADQDEKSFKEINEELWAKNSELSIKESAITNRYINPICAINSAKNNNDQDQEDINKSSFLQKIGFRQYQQAAQKFLTDAQKDLDFKNSKGESIGPEVSFDSPGGLASTNLVEIEDGLCHKFGFHPKIQDIDHETTDSLLRSQFVDRTFKQRLDVLAQQYKVQIEDLVEMKGKYQDLANELDQLTVAYKERFKANKAKNGAAYEQFMAKSIEYANFEKGHMFQLMDYVMQHRDVAERYGIQSMEDWNKLVSLMKEDENQPGTYRQKTKNETEEDNIKLNELEKLFSKYLEERIIQTMNKATQNGKLTIESLQTERQKAEDELKTFKEEVDTLAQKRTDMIKDKFFEPASKLCEMIVDSQAEEIEALGKHIEDFNKNNRLQLSSENLFTTQEDFCDALGKEIESNKKASFEKLGFGASVEYWFYDKFPKGSSQIPTV